LVSSPKYSGLKTEFLSSESVSLSSDCIAIKDTSNFKVIQIFDAGTGKHLQKLEHTLEIIMLQLNQIAGERKLAFIDGNKDLFVTPTNRPEIIKFAAMCDSLSWNDQTDMLSCLTDGKLSTWL